MMDYDEYFESYGYASYEQFLSEYNPYEEGEDY